MACGLSRSVRDILKTTRSIQTALIKNIRFTYEWTAGGLAGASRVVARVSTNPGVGGT